MAALKHLNVLFGICLLVNISQKIQAQSIDLTNYLQETVMGVQQGYEAKLVTEKGFGLGSFYQSRNTFLTRDKKSHSYSFYGGSLQIPFNRDCRVRVYGELKAGFANQKYFIATPEITTQYRVIPHIRLAISAGFRAQEPALAAKLILTTSKK